MQTVATPHLGVREHTFLEDYQLPKLDLVRTAVAWTLFQTGKDLFYTEHNDHRNSLLYKMATERQFLEPLQAFQQRRLYANLRNDFLVPLGTAGLITTTEIEELRKRHRNRDGIVERVTVEKFTVESFDHCYVNNDTDLSSLQAHMIRSLNSCGWEKVFVHFDGLLPNAHNKICALMKYTDTIDRLLGFQEGTYVMDEASEWFQE